MRARQLLVVSETEVRMDLLWYWLGYRRGRIEEAVKRDPLLCHHCGARLSETVTHGLDTSPRCSSCAARGRSAVAFCGWGLQGSGAWCGLTGLYGLLKVGMSGQAGQASSALAGSLGLLILGFLLFLAGMTLRIVSKQPAGRGQR